MKIAVAGGTGMVGRHVAEALRRAGHEVVVLARSRGVDIVAGDGLDEALAGVGAVVDATSAPEMDAEAARQFFGTATRNLLAAEERVGVGHHVALSIVNVDGVEGNGHFAGKRLQEEIVVSGPVPHTILRATQFHEFAGVVAGWMREGDVTVVPPLLVQPVAAADVADALAELAVGEPKGRVEDVAGPETHDFVDMARRTFEARGERVRIVPKWGDAPFGVEMAGNVLLPGPEARILPTTFDEWLDSLGGDA